MKENLIVIEQSAATWEDAIALCASALKERGLVDDGFLAACIDREKEFPTGLQTELGTAIPHTTANHVCDNAICVLKLPQPVDFCCMDDPDETVAVHYVFNLAVCDPQQQLHVLRTVMMLVQDGAFLRSCEKLSTDEIYTLLHVMLFS